MISIILAGCDGFDEFFLVDPSGHPRAEGCALSHWMDAILTLCGTRSLDRICARGARQRACHRWPRRRVIELSRVAVRSGVRYPEYLAAARPAFEKCGARFLLRRGPYAAREGNSRKRDAVIGFAVLNPCLLPERRISSCERMQSCPGCIPSMPVTSSGSLAATYAACHQLPIHGPFRRRVCAIGCRLVGLGLDAPQWGFYCSHAFNTAGKEGEHMTVMTSPHRAATDLPS